MYSYVPPALSLPLGRLYLIVGPMKPRRMTDWALKISTSASTANKEDYEAGAEKDFQDDANCSINFGACGASAWCH